MLDAFGQPSAAGGAPRIFAYSSTHASTDVTATGFFTGCGAGGRSANNIGLRLGDIIISRASTDASIPGRTSFHSVIGSTANMTSTSGSSWWSSSAGFDVTVSQSS